MDVPLRPIRDAVGPGPVELLREADPMNEAEHRIQAPVVEEPEAAHLVALETVVTAEETGILGIPELPDLLIEVAQVGDLEELWIEVEAPAAVRAEEPGRRGVRVGVRVDLVATGAGEDGAVEIRSRRDTAVDGVEEPAAGLLIRAEHVVERPVRVRRILHLEDEVGERPHVRLREDRVAPEQVLERAIELLERRMLVESPAVRLFARRVVAAGAVAAPVHRAVVGHAAQALRRHRALHRVEDGLHGLPRDHIDESAVEGAGVVDHLSVRIAEIPRQAVEIAEGVWLDENFAS